MTTLLLVAVFASAVPEPFPTLLQKAETASRSQDWKTACDAWDAVVARNPDNGAFWLALGLARYSAKDFRPAIAAYEKALALKAGYPAHSAFNIACCYGLLGEKEPALKWLDQALAMGFRDLAKVRTDADLKVLHDDPKFQELAAVYPDKLSREDGWRRDLALLVREIKRLHYNPYRTFTREQFDAEVKKLHDAIPKLSDPQIEVGFIKIARIAGDGHTHIRPGGQLRRMPVQLFHFAEGVFVTAAHPVHAALAGAQVLKIGD